MNIFPKKRDASVIKYKRIRGFSKRDNPIYLAWSGMMRRCYSKNSSDYKYYGERGILVEKKWHEFINFYNDMKNEYFSGLQIDRINTNKGYFKENCRWSNRRTQCNNRRSNRYLINPKTKEKKTITEWSRIYGISRNTITSRIRLGYKKFDHLICKQHEIRNGSEKCPRLRS